MVNCPLCGRIMKHCTRKDQFVVGRYSKNSYRVVIDYEYLMCDKCEGSYTTNELDELNDSKIKNEVRDQKIKKVLRKKSL